MQVPRLHILHLCRRTAPKARTILLFLRGRMLTHTQLNETLFVLLRLPWMLCNRGSRLLLWGTYDLAGVHVVLPCGLRAASGRVSEDLSAGFLGPLAGGSSVSHPPWPVCSGKDSVQPSGRTPSLSLHTPVSLMRRRCENWASTDFTEAFVFPGVRKALKPEAKKSPRTSPSTGCSSGLVVTAWSLFCCFSSAILRAS